MSKIILVLLAILLPSHALNGITGSRQLRQVAPSSPSLTPIISAQNPVRIIPAVKQSISFIKSAAVVNEQGGSSNTGSSNKAASVAYTPAWDRNRNVEQQFLEYRGGLVMTGDLAVYLIFYGSWDRRNNDNVRTMNALTHLAKYIGSSSWINTNRQYYQEGKGDRQYADGSITYKGSVIVPSDGKTSINDEDMSALMDDMISSRKLPLDAGFGFFMFITTPDISVKKGNDEFCTRFCGFHTAFSYRGTQGRGRVKYAVVGATSRCWGQCSAFSGPDDGWAPTSPEADSMANILAHEMVEVISNPYSDAWYDRFGFETADQCIWQFSNTQTEYWGGREVKYTVNVGGRGYMIQDNYSIKDVGGRQQGCVNSL